MEPDAFSAAPFWTSVAAKLCERLGAESPDDGRVCAALWSVYHGLAAAVRRKVLPKLSEVLDQATSGHGEVSVNATFSPDRSVFWGYARLFFLSRVTRADEDPQDVASECVVHLSRYFSRLESRHELVRNVEALMTRIAWCRVTDTWGGWDVEPIDETSQLAATTAAPDEGVHRRELRQRLFAVRQYLSSRFRCPSCLEIFDRLDAGATERLVGEEFNVTREVVAQRLRRCRRELVELREQGRL